MAVAASISSLGFCPSMKARAAFIAIGQMPAARQARRGGELTSEAVTKSLDWVPKAFFSRAHQIFPLRAGGYGRALLACNRRSRTRTGLSGSCGAGVIRKAVLRQLAEKGRSSKEIAALSGHKTLKEIERYTEKADQGRMVIAAIGCLPGH